MNKDSIPPMPIEGYFHVYAKSDNRVYIKDENGDTWDVTDYVDHEIRDGAIYIPSDADFYAALEKAKQGD